MDKAGSPQPKHGAQGQSHGKASTDHHAQFARLKDLLHDVPQEDRDSLYNHLCDILKEMYRSDPNKKVDFEKLSRIIKNTSHQYSDLQSEQEVNRRKDRHNEHKAYENKIKSLIDFRPKPDQYLETKIQDIVAENHYWKRAGLGIDDQDALLLQKAMEKLANEKHIKRLKFFGVFQTTGKDYYVIEGNSLKNYQEKLPEEYEARGFGVNSYTYWVSNNLLGEWIELPLISPQQLSVARLIKVAMKGDLHRKIEKTIPPFPGTEAHYLRAQIVRIAFNTQIAPNGVFKLSEKQGKLKC